MDVYVQLFLDWKEKIETQTLNQNY